MLTERQQEIFRYIESQDPPPTAREIAGRFKISVGTVAQHLGSLRQKGLLASAERQARSLRPLNSFREHQRRIVHIPLYGSIPAGLAEDRSQEAEGCVSVDVGTLGIKVTSRTFALRVSGDSMIGKHICDGDIVVLEHGAEPRPGQIVAALIDRKSTLKTFVVKSGKTFLKAENPRYPNLIPSEELVIQGVFRALIRRGKD